MSNYTITTDFSVKDGLASGNPNKLIKGVDFDTEFVAIRTAVNSKADTAAPSFTGTTNFVNINFTGDITGTIDGGTF
jgi:hypothetical protein